MVLFCLVYLSWAEVMYLLALWCYLRASAVCSPRWRVYCLWILMNQEDNEHLKHVCMRTNLVTEPGTAWQGNRGCIELYAGHLLKGTFGTHYSKPISLFWLKVTLSRWLLLSVISADCLTATDITSLKTCLTYYRLVPLVGAVGHVSQTVTVDHPRYGAVSRLLNCMWMLLLLENPSFLLKGT